MGGERAAAPAGELRGGTGGSRDEAEGVGKRLLRGDERDCLVQLRAGGYRVADVKRGVVGTLNSGPDMFVQPERGPQTLETGISGAALRVPVATRRRRSRVSVGNSAGGLRAEERGIKMM